MKNKFVLSGILILSVLAFQVFNYIVIAQSSPFSGGGSIEGCPSTDPDSLGNRLCISPGMSCSSITGNVGYCKNEISLLTGANYCFCQAISTTSDGCSHYNNGMNEGSCVNPGQPCTIQETGEAGTCYDRELPPAIHYCSCAKPHCSHDDCSGVECATTEACDRYTCSCRGSDCLTSDASGAGACLYPGSVCFIMTTTAGNDTVAGMCNTHTGMTSPYCTCDL